MTEIALFADSRGSNTREIADAMAVELGFSTGDLTALLSADAKVLFPGSGTNESAPGSEMIKFVKDTVFYGF
jgi:flavodoxin